MGAANGYYEDPSSVRRIQKSFEESGGKIDAIHTPVSGFRPPEGMHSIVLHGEDLVMYNLQGVLRPNSTYLQGVGYSGD